MDNPLDFLDGQEPAETPAAATTQPTETPPAASQETARDDKGRFAPKTEASAEAPAPVAPQPPATPPEAAQPVTEARPPEGYVPVSALQALRDELKAFKQQALHPQQPSEPAPDPYEDFEGYQQWQQSQFVAERAEWSFQLAAMKHGEERAQEVKQWAAERFATDPVFAQRAMSNRDPYGVAFDEWKREQVFSKLSDPALLDRFLALAAGQSAAPQQAPSAPPPQQPAAPPPSITDAPSAGGVQHIPLGQTEVYKAVFG